MLALVALSVARPAVATVRVAAPGAAATALASAVDGDTVILAAGIHRGPLTVARRLTLRGAPGAVLDGGGSGTVLAVRAPGARIESLEIRGSGRRVITVDTGILIQSSPGVAVRNVRMRDVLYGVYVERSEEVSIAACDLAGRVKPLDDSGEGNGIHLWYSPRPRLEDNQVRGFVDAIYLSFVNGARVTGNRLEHNGRYGLHTMYCQGMELERNAFLANLAGCAIMFSNHLAVTRNQFLHNRGPRTYGLLLRDCSDGEFRDNQLVDNTVAVFMDNSNRNRIEGNLVQDNGWGVLLFSSCAGNQFDGNSFVNDDYPVALDMRYSSNRFDDGHHGNYWSENAPYDLDADGVSDVAYAPVSAFAFLSKQVPDLAVLAKSPAVAALGVAERVLPALRPSEIVDSFPLVDPPRARTSAPPSGAPVTRPWGAVAGFAGLLGAGVAGLMRSAR
jgi:nitrous oxidase accessory protein